MLYIWHGLKCAVFIQEIIWSHLPLNFGQILRSVVLGTYSLNPVKGLNRFVFQISNEQS